MRTPIKAAALSILALCGANQANASILGPSIAGGSEGLLTFINTGDNSTITQDIGVQFADIGIGDEFSLSASVISFINGAGGLANVNYSLIAGSAASPTTAGSYLQTSDNATMTALANGVRGVWYGSLNTFITNLTQSDGAAGNISYGPFAAGAAANYLTGQGRDDWGAGGSCIANDNFCNVVAGTSEAFLHLVNFNATALGVGSIGQLGGGAKAVLDLAGAKLSILATTTPVPAPAGVWLLATAVGGLAVRARRRKAQSLSKDQA